MPAPNIRRLVPYIVLALLALLEVSACGNKDDAKAIHMLIQKGAALAEKHNIADLLKLAAPDFTAQPGRYDSKGVHGVLWGAFHYYGRFKIHYPRPAIRLDKSGKGAAATFHFVIVRQDRSLPGLRELYDDPQRWLEAAGEMADLYHLQLQWIKIDGDWKVKQARLEGFRGF